MSGHTTPRAKPLDWYTPTDHPSDPEDALLAAHGIGGRYAITQERDGWFLLWLADDPFIWEAFPALDLAQERGEQHWQAAFAAAAVSPTEIAK